MYVFIDIFPLLAIPLILYNFVVLTTISGSGDQVQSWFASPIFTVHSFSGDAWNVSAGDIFLLISLLLLFIEIVKSTRTDALSLINHGLAALVFVVFLIEFLTLHGFTNSIFGLLMIMQLVDVVAGYTVTAVAAKRDFGSPGGIIGTR